MRSMIVLSTLLAAGAAGAAPKGLTVDDMLAMQRVGESVVSPDGKHVAFAVRDTDVEANRGRFDIWVAAVDGSGVTRMTSHPENDSDPQWSADGKWIYFVSSRSGSSQVWRIALAGGEAEQVTHLPIDVEGFRTFPDGKRLLLVIDVWPDAKTLTDSAKHDDAWAKSKVHARAYDQLLYRHWDHWEDGKFLHLFTWTSDAQVKDLVPGQLGDTPVQPFGGVEQVSISPDSKWVAFEARLGGREMAWTTNTDIFLVPADGSAKPTDLTPEGPGYEQDPAFSPDGRSILYASMARGGYEADRRRLAVYDVAAKKSRLVAEGWDRSPEAYAWSRDGKTVLASADNVGNTSIYAIDVATGNAKVLVDKGSNTAPRVAGDRIVYGHDSLTSPVELYTVPATGGEPRAITHFNDARLAQIAWGKYEQFSFKGAKGDTVYGFVVQPANLRAGDKVPVAMLIHGGPQGSFNDHFHYRWNPEVYAGHGYASVFIDFHGSTGYGQAFTDAIRGDWGGGPYEDIMAGLDAALAKYSYLDGTRVVALGASYGGYMINWIAGKTDRFRALVCHDGIFDTRIGYYDTEELWFPEWEHKGTPWDKPEEFAKWNPAEYVKNWKTPELVIHGALDYRIPDSHGMAAFSALQRRGVPSRYLEFPDENHWVLKPQNSKRWHEEVLAWIDRWTKRGK